MPGRGLLSIDDLEPAELRALVDETLAPRTERVAAVVGLFFLQPSTRTRLGFQAAVARLGGQSVELQELKETGQMSSGESWADTVRSVGPYFDAVCVRHPDPYATAEAGELLPDVPVINCGNGTDEHPTQSVADLAAIARYAKLSPHGLRVTVAGDLRYMRAAHSLVLALAKVGGVCVTGVSPGPLALPERYSATLDGNGGTFRTAATLEEALDTDVLYMAGFAPRTPAGEWDDASRRPYRLTASVARQLPADSVILCPLPRVDEIESEVDVLPQARYFEQSELALHARVAVLRRALAPPVSPDR